MIDRGRIIASYGATCLLRFDDGIESRCKVKGRSLKPITGDYVRIEDDGAGAPVIVGIEERRNAFPRVTRGGDKVDLVANVDRVIIVVAAKPAPSRDLVDKYLVACELINVPAAVLLNKTDLLTSEQRDDWHRHREILRDIGYPVAQSQVKGETNLSGLKDLLGSGTGILVGQSGVGKSSLIGALVPQADPKTAEISNATGKGRHTTTTARLFDTPGGGAIADSPGVWEYGLWDMTPRDIAAGFVDFAQYRHECRFNDCRHLTEPDCAVREAAENGDIHNIRYQSFVRLAS